MIFYGPPGTGKTYVARRLARFLAPDDQHRKTVQFHPVYTLRGLRRGLPAARGRRRERPFELTAGSAAPNWRKIAEESAEPCVLLIDEINRGNIAKVFGELYYLLEYRRRRRSSSSTGRSRSSCRRTSDLIGDDEHRRPVDRAPRRGAAPPLPLRRLLPGPAARRGLAAAVAYSDTRPTMVYVADVVDAANACSPDRHLQIGPSHFMRQALTEAVARADLGALDPAVHRGAVLRRARPREEFTLAAIEHA